MVLASENDSKIDVFSHFFRRRRFFENEQKPLKKLWFSLIFQVRSLQKSAQNRCQNAIEKSIAKKAPKNRFWLPFWAPKSSQNRSKVDKNRKKIALKKTRKKKAHANQRYSQVLSGSQAFWDPHGPSNYHSND